MTKTMVTNGVARYFPDLDKVNIITKKNLTLSLKNHIGCYIIAKLQELLMFLMHLWDLSKRREKEGFTLFSMTYQN